MNIKSVETKYISQNPFAGLFAEEPEFTPYYNCKITTDTGHFFGNGETQEAANRDAVENMKAFEAAKVREAMSKYNAEQGIYFIDC